MHRGPRKLSSVVDREDDPKLTYNVYTNCYKFASYPLTYMLSLSIYMNLIKYHHKMSFSIRIKQSFKKMTRSTGYSTIWYKNDILWRYQTHAHCINILKIKTEWFAKKGVRNQSSGACNMLNKKHYSAKPEYSKHTTKKTTEADG